MISAFDVLAVMLFAVMAGLITAGFVQFVRRALINLKKKFK